MKPAAITTGRLLLTPLRPADADVTANIHPAHRSSAAVAARIGMAPTDRDVDGERVWQTTAEASPGPGEAVT